ncbi:magnesium Mg(2+) and cobalt Co(2+) transport protein CorA [Cyanobium gracile PCC 6307]|uniref:Magnesium transport protein CorA n=2 Tax=Cyanobium gracile TaxID=59930 RepID=K9P8P8_CYAGP|nr:magnesium Mg(2+) and cobalt Co(2+) transport protein CorA [Cyanobium gracile PCC 6307]
MKTRPSRPSMCSRGAGGIRSRRIRPGSPPGTVEFVGEQRLAKVQIDVIHYDAEGWSEHRDASVHGCADVVAEGSITWMNVSGVHDVALVERLGARFGLHPMTLEDIANTTQRPKVEEFPGYIFMVLKMIAFNEDSQTIDIEHVSVILGDHFVMSFLEDDGDVFDGVRDRIRSSGGRIRWMKADYLAYSLLDAVVDHYFLAVERMGDIIEEVDDRLLEDPHPGDIKEIHSLKRSILSLRKAVWPIREEVAMIVKSESPLLTAESRVFWRDLYDHCIQIIDLVETHRDILGGMHDTYLSTLSHRMNEVMKVLTIISTIFIPLTFIAGVYGMNFKEMPELEWRGGYYSVWALMIVIGISLYLYFRRKQWL